MRTPLDRFHSDPVFATLVRVFLREFESQDKAGAGLTPSEVREASSLAWQFYLERNAYPIVAVEYKPYD